MRSLQRFGAPLFASLAALCGLLVSPAVASTEVEELVMYGIDGDTDHLLRYSFETDTFVDIGLVQTAGGVPVHDCESLAWVPSGPGRGMYTAPRADALEAKLVRINPMDATCEVIADFEPTGWKDINAMVTIQNPLTGDWFILAHDFNDDDFVVINPVDGSISLAFTIPGIEFEGLARGPDGTIYANTDTALYTIDPSTGVETFIGNTGANKMEALEYAFGDGAPQINIPGIPAAWTADGALIGFDDSGSELMVLDPATGSSQEYVGSFIALDCEGLVFLTKTTDAYGVVVVDACD